MNDEQAAAPVAPVIPEAPTVPAAPTPAEADQTSKESNDKMILEAASAIRKRQEAEQDRVVLERVRSLQGEIKAEAEAKPLYQKGDFLDLMKELGVEDGVQVAYGRAPKEFEYLERSLDRVLVENKNIPKDVARDIAKSLLIQQASRVTSQLLLEEEEASNARLTQGKSVAQYERVLQEVVGDAIAKKELYVYINQYETEHKVKFMDSTKSDPEFLRLMKGKYNGLVKSREGVTYREQHKSAQETNRLITEATKSVMRASDIDIAD